MRFLLPKLVRYANVPPLQFRLRRYPIMAEQNYSGHLLCAIPYPEPRQVLDNIRFSYPGLKVTYIQTKLPQPGTQMQRLPAGMIPMLVLRYII